LSKRAKIFIIDDDVSVREAMELLIQLLGHDTEAFGSAEEYLSCGHHMEAECLITDVHMSGMTGLDLQNRLQTEGCRLPIIFMSGNPSDELRAAAMTAGAIAVLDKPVNVDSLVDCLHKALRSGLSG
jgi:FixJ family two-component response regulator